MFKKTALLLLSAAIFLPSAAFADGNDACPGATISALPFNDTGTTIGGDNTINAHATAACTGYTASAGPDKIYRIVVATAGSLTITVTPSSGYDTSIYLLNDAVTACPAGTGNTAAAAACVDGADSGLTNTAETVTAAALPAGNYSFYVDSFYSAGSAGSPNRHNGPFTIAVSGTAVLGGGTAADTSITKTDGVTSVIAGGSTTYTITASNAGPGVITDGTVADTFPAACTSVAWTCAGAAGGVCAANGSGNINDATVDLPVGGSVTYTATCNISGAASGSLVNTATVANQAGTPDPTPGNNSATDTDTITTNVPPVFAYAPTPTSAVNFTGGGAVGSTGNGSIAVSIQTAGVGTGAASTTTTTCTAPGAPFAGFGQSVTAEGAGTISGGPLTGTCTLGVAQVVATLTCSENQGGTPVSRTFELTCPAGSLAPLTSTPATGATVTLPSQLPGGATTTALINFQNPNAAPIDVTCTAPAAPFSAAPLLFTVPANGSASTTVSFNSATVGSFTGTLDCTAGNQNFSFNLAGSALSPDVPVPAIGDAMRNLLVLLTLALGGLALGFRRRA